MKKLHHREDTLEFARSASSMDDVIDAVNALIDGYNDLRKKIEGKAHWEEKWMKNE